MKRNYVLYYIGKKRLINKFQKKNNNNKKSNFSNYLNEIMLFVYIGEIIVRKEKKKKKKKTCQIQNIEKETKNIKTVHVSLNFEIPGSVKCRLSTMGMQLICVSTVKIMEQQRSKGQFVLIVT